MRESVADLWTFQCEARCVTTNGAYKKDGRAVMGRGCAKEARDRYRGLDKDFGSLLRTYGNRVLIIRAVLDEPDLVAFPVKHHWADLADTALIVKSARELVDLATKSGWANVALPRPGCGNGGLKWDEVRALIAPILDDRFTVLSQ